MEGSCGGKVRNYACEFPSFPLFFLFFSFFFLFFPLFFSFFFSFFSFFFSLFSFSVPSKNRRVFREIGEVSQSSAPNSCFVFPST